MRLHQLINTSAEPEPSHSIATSSQATEGAPCQPLRVKRRLIMSKSMIGMTKLRKKLRQQRKRS
jgi:hypothetical protein